jgi:ribosomal protein S18 acetylase RimI-like enzyme
MAPESAHLFASPALAARLDRAEGRLCASIARAVAAGSARSRAEVFDIGGGVAVFAGPASPTNKMIGVGFDGPLDEHELDLVERAFAERGAPLQAEVATLADPSVHALLVRRGYLPRGFENVLGHSLERIAAPPAGVQVDRAAEGELADWADVVISGFATPDEGSVGSGDPLPPTDELRAGIALTMSLSGFQAAVARLDGHLVGGGSLRLDARIAQFSGAATLPAFRRRGVQTALLRWRLAHARASGCDIGVVTTYPASKSQENVQREGFSLLYARQLLVKAP